MWQIRPHPSCNSFHEVGWYLGEGGRRMRIKTGGKRNLAGSVSKLERFGTIFERQNITETKPRIKVLGWGGSRTSYLVNFASSDSVPIVIKGPHYGRDEAYWYEKQSKDGIILEKATSSPYIPDTYGFCGLNVMMEFSKGGSIYDYLRGSRYRSVASPGTPAFVESTFNNLEKLKVAHQIARAVATMHEIGEGLGLAPAFAHNDICCHQFLFFDGVFKLNDFDHAKTIKINQVTGKICREPSGMKTFKMRAPEEMVAETANKKNVGAERVQVKFATDKVDVYLMGNVLYYLLTNKYLFEGLSRDAAVRKIIQGERSSFFGAENSTQPAILAIVRAISMCWVHNPDDRPTSRDVALFLANELAKTDEEFRETRVCRVTLPKRMHMLSESDWDNNN